MLYPHKLSQEQGADGIDVVLNSLSNLAVQKDGSNFGNSMEIPSLDMGMDQYLLNIHKSQLF